MTLSLSRLCAILALSCIAAPAFACVDSPENPTLLLSAIGGAAACLPWLKAELRARLPRHQGAQASPE